MYSKKATRVFATAVGIDIFSDVISNVSVSVLETASDLKWHFRLSLDVTFSNDTETTLWNDVSQLTRSYFYDVWRYLNEQGEIDHSLKYFSTEVSSISFSLAQLCGHNNWLKIELLDLNSFWIATLAYLEWRAWGFQWKMVSLKNLQGIHTEIQIYTLSGLLVWLILCLWHLTQIYGWSVPQTMSFMSNLWILWHSKKSTNIGNTM